jgi:hypothetical protein
VHGAAALRGEVGQHPDDLGVALGGVDERRDERGRRRRADDLRPGRPRVARLCPRHPYALTVKGAELPARFHEEPITAGPYAGAVLSRESFAEARAALYAELGWHSIR